MLPRHFPLLHESHRYHLKIHHRFRPLPGKCTRNLPGTILFTYHLSTASLTTPTLLVLVIMIRLPENLIRWSRWYPSFLHCHSMHTSLHNWIILTAPGENSSDSGSYPDPSPVYFSRSCYDGAVSHFHPFYICNCIEFSGGYHQREYRYHGHVVFGQLNWIWKTDSVWKGLFFSYAIFKCNSATIFLYGRFYIDHIFCTTDTGSAQLPAIPHTRPINHFLLREPHT